MINIGLMNLYLTTFINVFIVFPSLIYLLFMCRKQKEQKMNFLKLVNIMDSKFKNEKEEIEFFKNNFSQFFKKDIGSDEIAGRIIVNYKNGEGDYCLILKKDILYHKIYNYFVFTYEERAWNLKRGCL